MIDVGGTRISKPLTDIRPTLEAIDDIAAPRAELIGLGVLNQHLIAGALAVSIEVPPIAVSVPLIA